LKKNILKKKKKIGIYMDFRLIFILLLFINGCSKTNYVNTSYLQLIHNKERLINNLNQLEYDSNLEIFAQNWSNNMASKSRLHHSDMSFNRFSFKGENLSFGQENEDIVLRDWMNSKEHRKNILNFNFTHVGFGCSEDKNGKLYWCACFGG